MKDFKENPAWYTRESRHPDFILVILAIIFGLLFADAFVDEFFRILGG